MHALPLVLALQAATLAPLPAPPAAAPVQDTRYGLTVVDPYRQLEDVTDPAVAGWIRAQAAHTRELLDAIPQRRQVLADIQRLEAATPSKLEDAVLMRDDRILVRRMPAGAESANLYLREGADGRERLLLDPRAGRDSGAPQRAISYAVPSPDGRLIAVGLSEGGSEEATVQVIDSSDGRSVDAPIPRVDFGVSWLPGGRGFFYNQLKALTPGEPVSQRQLDSQARLHLLGQPPERDRVVFGSQAPTSGPFSREQIPLVTASDDSRWVLGEPATVESRRVLRVARLADVLEGQASHWQPLLALDDNIRSYLLRGDDVYLLSSAQPTRSIQRLSLADPSHRRSTWVPAGEGVIDEIYYGNEALYYTVRAPSGVGMKLFRLPWAGGAPAEVPMQGGEALRVHAAQPGSRGLLVGVDGWTRFFDVLRVDTGGQVASSGLQAQPQGVTSDGLVAETVEVASTDGAMVPLSIVSRRGTPRDGSAPLFLQGYGAYGISTDPVLLPAHLAYFDRGFTRAFCHVRGGGEKGEAWYRAGFQASKHHSWEDFNACADYLVSHGYTRGDRLGAAAGSAGGILVGNAFLARPELYRAVIPMVGVLDSVGTALRDPNGPGNWAEFGDPNTEAGFRSLLGMSAYAKVRDGIAYPAVLLTHGFNDPRVAVWNSAKMAARLQQATRSGRPVLLDIDYDAGHGIGSAQSSIDNQRADMITFLLWQFGTPGYAPAISSAAAAGR